MEFKIKKDQKYIFAADLDGTFLSNHDGAFHILNYEAIKRIKEDGHIFVITTGRSWWWAQKIYTQLNVVDAVIHFSGAQVHHPLDPNFKKYLRYFLPEEVKKILKEFNIANNSKIIRVDGEKKHAEITEAEQIDLINFDAYEFSCFLIKDTLENDEKHIELYNKLIKKYPKYIIRLWDYGEHYHLTISPAGAGKEMALEYVANHYKISRKNVIYFGDNINDIKALEWAAYGYVPANAKPEAKEVADEILDKENWEGVVAAKIIQLLDEAK